LEDFIFLKFKMINYFTFEEVFNRFDLAPSFLVMNKAQYFFEII